MVIHGHGVYHLESFQGNLLVSCPCCTGYAVADPGGGGVTGVITPLVAEIFVCSNSNFSPTGAITPLSGPPWPLPPPPPSENPVSAPVMQLCP